jgi:hypothetical protein
MTGCSKFGGDQFPARLFEVLGSLLSHAEGLGGLRTSSPDILGHVTKSTFDTLAVLHPIRIHICQVLVVCHVFSSLPVQTISYRLSAGKNKRSVVYRVEPGILLLSFFLRDRAGGDAGEEAAMLVGASHHESRGDDGLVECVQVLAHSAGQRVGSLPCFCRGGEEQSGYGCGFGGAGRAGYAGR